MTPLELLAWVAWGEAEGEPLAGQLAVMHSIMNRVAKPRWWGSNLQAVILHANQYDGLRRVPHNPGPPPTHFLTMAKLVLDGHTIDPSLGSTHFYACYIPKPWPLPERVRIGNHIFCEEA